MNAIRGQGHMLYKGLYLMVISAPPGRFCSVREEGLINIVESALVVYNVRDPWMSTRGIVLLVEQLNISN